MKSIIAAAALAICAASTASAEWQATPVMSDLTPGQVLYVTWTNPGAGDDHEAPEPVSFGGWHNPGADDDSGPDDDSGDFGGWSK